MCAEEGGGEADGAVRIAASSPLRRGRRMTVRETARGTRYGADRGSRSKMKRALNGLGEQVAGSDVSGWLWEAA